MQHWIEILLTIVRSTFSVSLLVLSCFWVFEYKFTAKQESSPVKPYRPTEEPTSEPLS